MRVYHFLLVAIQAVSLIEAADRPDPPNSIKWTLDRSCYRNSDDTADDNDLAKAMIETVDKMKAWAEGGAKKLDDSMSSNPVKGRRTKRAMMPLIDSDDYKDGATYIRDKFKELGKLEGPIGKDGDDGEKYDQSTAWADLGNSDEHWWDFLIICRPRVSEVDTPLGSALYDEIRQYELPQNSYLKSFIDEEDSFGDWDKITGGRTQAITSRDRDDPPEGGRGRIPQSITFHPLLLKHHRDGSWEDWSKDEFKKATAKEALETFKQKSKVKDDGGNAVDKKIRPVDAVLDASFTRAMFHEMFHLSAFGAMIDNVNDAYGWVNNVDVKSPRNPDRFAIIAATIELLNKSGDKYKVSEEGELTRIYV